MMWHYGPKHTRDMPQYVEANLMVVRCMTKRSKALTKSLSASISLEVLAPS